MKYLSSNSKLWFLKKMKSFISMGLLKANIGLCMKIRFQNDRQVSYTLELKFIICSVQFYWM